MEISKISGIFKIFTANLHRLFLNLKHFKNIFSLLYHNHIMNDEIKVTFQPEGKSVYVLPGTTVLEAALHANIVIDVPCGGKGGCGKCKVEIIIGASEPNSNELKFLSSEELNRGIRLACQSKIYSPTTVQIPLEKRVYEQEILIHGGRTDKEQPQIIPDKGRKTPSSSSPQYGLAIDIGTTTVVVMLLDLNSEEQLAADAQTNPQSIYGDDVISRIHYSNSTDGGLEALHNCIISTINDSIQSLCAQTGIEHTQIYEICVAGNTTMNHLFLKINPSPLGESPYIPVVTDAVNTKAKDLHLLTNKDANVYTLPNIAGFVGGDIPAGIIASGIYDSDTITLMVDIGTNGEIVLGNKKRLVCCSTAAGPAFEGARISQGMRAMNGAVEEVMIANEEVMINVIGNVLPRGICGTGLIDAAAELLKIGVIDSSGKILRRNLIKNSLPENILKRIVKGDLGYNFILVESEFTENKQPIQITQRDVRELQLAKGAISAGITIAMQEYGITINDIEKILLAGAFGNYIRRESAQYVGILPNIPIEKILFIGNAAGAGAKMALISRQYRSLAEQVARQVDYIELANNPQFQHIFMDAMAFVFR